MLYKIGLYMVVVIALAGCANKDIEGSKQEAYSRDEYVLGTIASIQLLEGGSQALLDESFDRLREIEDQMSVTIDHSQLYQLNLLSSGLASNEEMTPFKLEDDVMAVVRAGIYYGQLSEGDFDITMGPIIGLWQIGTEDARIPKEEEIDRQLRFVDYKQVLLNEEESTVTLSPKMLLNLGGIAKGYAADEVGEILVSAGVKRAIINLGGNVKVIGSKADKVPFRIGIQNPFDQRNDYLGVLSVEDQTIVTSGDYERYFEVDGVRYHHIFDQTGYPVRNEVASVTVVAKSSIDADALSTILFIQGVDNGIDLVNQLSDVECIYIMKNKEVYLSSEALMSVFRLTDQGFRLAESK